MKKNSALLIGLSFFGISSVSLADPAPWTARALTQDEKDRMLNVSWKPNCPVSRDQLRVVNLEYIDFGGHVHVGPLVVHQKIATQVISIFKTIRAYSFPIEKITTIEEFGGEDLRAQSANATTAFNCREVEGKPGVFSNHARGLAMDINPVLNPYKGPNGWEPQNGRANVQRSPLKTGMLSSSGKVVKLFESLGWRWGGRWVNETDYQHFDRKMPDAR